MDLSLGERCVTVAMLEMGVREIPAGSNTSVRIKEYLAGCVRGPDDINLRLKASNWCSAFVGWCQAKALRPGEHPAHGWRAGVLEVEQDTRDASAKFSGRWHSIREARDGIWLPMVGDCCVYDRSLPKSQDPKGETSWYRHIDRIVEYRLDGSYSKIGGNEADQVRLGEGSLDNPRLLGFVAYPRQSAEPQRAQPSAQPMLTENERRELLANVALSLDGIMRASLFHGDQ